MQATGFNLLKSITIFEATNFLEEGHVGGHDKFLEARVPQSPP